MMPGDATSRTATRQIGVVFPVCFMWRIACQVTVNIRNWWYLCTYVYVGINKQNIFIQTCFVEYNSQLAIDSFLFNIFIVPNKFSSFLVE